MDESRKQFDEAYERMQYDHFGSNRDFAWKFWQASRAAVEINWPALGIDSSGGTYHRRDDMRKELSAAGIKVKE